MALRFIIKWIYSMRDIFLHQQHMLVVILSHCLALYILLSVQIRTKQARFLFIIMSKKVMCRYYCEFISRDVPSPRLSAFLGLIYSLNQPHSGSISTDVSDVKTAIVGSQDTVRMKKISKNLIVWKYHIKKSG
jgi:hypothetical protein